MSTFYLNKIATDGISVLTPCKTESQDVAVSAHTITLKRLRKYILVLLFAVVCTTASAQIGSYRNDLAVGFNGGYNLNSIMFVPSVQQSMLGGMTIGFTARYVCEKYFNTICAVQLELNYSQLGWKEKIQDINGVQCVLNKTNEDAAYTRNIDYIQMPLLAHLGWGREERGMKFFLNMGPQFGYLLGEKTKTNFIIKYNEESELPTYSDVTPSRVSNEVAQDTMAVQNKFDYGITAGLGLELSLKRIGHIMVEGRYYYGLGCIFKDSKSDYFARSNHSSIIIKATYLFDIVRTKGAKRK